MERSPAVEGPRLSFATTAEDMWGLQKAYCFSGIVTAYQTPTGTRAAGSRESVRYRKAPDTGRVPFQPYRVREKS